MSAHGAEPRIHQTWEEKLPLVSLIMAVRNEHMRIEPCLRAILEQDYPHHRMEVVIADGMSTDHTKEAIATIASGSDIPVEVLDNPKFIVSPGLNHAIARARGEIIVRIDGHTVIAADYVRQCVAALQRTGADNVGGRMDPVGETRFGKAVALATTSPFGVGGGRFHYSQKEEWVDTVYLGCWRRSVFEKTGLFDEEQVRNQDDEFNYRLREHGGKISLCPSIKSVYYNRATPGSLWSQYQQYGEWKVRVLQKHPGQMQPRQFVPPIFVLALVALTVLAPFWRIALPFWALVLGSYLIANSAASMIASRGGNRRLLPSLMVVFAILHLSYGFGFLRGLVRFWDRWATPHLFPSLRDIRQPDLPQIASSDSSSLAKSL
jgi:succinoglycan biosynthesis protein ExoA